MLNFIWGTFIIGGLVFSIITGKSDTITDSILSGGKEAISLCITMAGVISIWTGIMEIAEKSGMIKGISKKLDPILSFLFPNIPKNSVAREYIATNFTANFFGLGWASTPAGLLAMEELQKLNKKKDTASDDMCMFMIVNMSSLQLVTMNIIAYRSQYMSKNPSEIIFAGILATVVSTIAGVIFAKVMGRRNKKWKSL
ncbi:MAG: nucleoside recognition protein [Tyzzerella sp.]|uniref:Nucleoside recognition protein n=1 Tax=Candidatus Fimicola merdigallinarum TaxID=2840819 RepID=A0A9D9DUP9_9FIRM|nr:nucleoside recognition protein [Candidatus Fimicola merdigallinarum]